MAKDPSKKSRKAQEERELLQFAAMITRVAKTVRPSMYFRVTAKERLLAAMERPTISLWAMVRQLFSRQYATAYAMVFLVLFVVSSLIPVGTLNEVRASEIGSINIDYGVVRVRRGNEVLLVHSGERLYIGDEILVEDGAQASVEFIDKTSGVIGENSSVAIRGAQIDKEDPEESQIALELKEGRFDAQMGQDEPKKNGQGLRIDTPGGVVATSRASFGVAVSETGDTEVVAYTENVHVAARNEEGSAMPRITSREEGGAVTSEGPVEAVLVATEDTGSGAVLVDAQTTSPASAGAALEFGGRKPVITDTTDTLIVTVSEEDELLSITEMNRFRTELQFAEIKLQQAERSFRGEDLKEFYDTLHAYHSRIAAASSTYLGVSLAIPERGNEDALLSARTASALLVSLRSMEIDPSTEQIYGDLFVYLRRMIALETTLRQDVPAYYVQQQHKALPFGDLHRTARALYPVVEELITLEKQRAAADTFDKAAYTTDIEARITTIVNKVMTQQRMDAREVLLEDIFSMVPNDATYRYFVLRFKVHLPGALHGIVDRKAAQMN